MKKRRHIMQAPIERTYIHACYDPLRQAFLDTCEERGILWGNGSKPHDYKPRTAIYLSVEDNTLHSDWWPPICFRELQLKDFYRYLKGSA